MADEPTVSVVITTFHRNDLLRGAIESALDQRHEPVEVVVVDGSGTRHACDVAAGYDVTYLPQSENVGPVADRNRGVERASGEYVHLLDDDDRLTPDALSKKVARARETDAGVVYSGLRRERDGAKPLLPDPNARGDVLELALRMQQPPIFPSTMLMRRDILERCVPLPASYRGAGDTALVIELARRTAFEFVDEPLMHRGEAETSLAYTEEAVRARRLLLSAYSDLYDEYPDAVRRTALAGSYAIEGQVRLAERAWTPAAVRAFALACYYEPRLDRAGALAASLFGRRAWLAARSLFVGARRARGG